MEILYTNCAGLDIHKKTVVVCADICVQWAISEGVSYLLLSFPSGRLAPFGFFSFGIGHSLSIEDCLFSALLYLFHF